MVQRMELREVLKDPKLAAKLTPSMALTEQLLRDKSNLSGVALATAKGSRPHVLAGRTFAAAMLVGLALAVPAIAAR